MTENKRFNYLLDEIGYMYYICDGGKTEDKIFAEVSGDVEDVTDKLNELYEEKEKWKHNCLNTVSENSILWNEISILIEQCALPSDAFKNYLNNLKNKNKKLQGDM